MQNQNLDSKMFLDRLLLILEFFWTPCWILKSMKTKLKIKRIVETILDAILEDLGSKVR